jgi:hypothetical protein
MLFIACSSIIQYKALASMEKPKQKCSLTINSTQLSPDHVSLNFSLKNPYNKKMRLLIWHTPFEGFLSDLFIITNKDTGKKLNYQGPMVKRLQPQPEDYLSLTPNQISSTTFNLSFSYYFKQGSYQLQLKKSIFHFEDEHLTPFLFTCETPRVNFSIK